MEAARAGEQGRGFAVVAGEVRSLAQRSAEAAKEIKSLIGASVDRVESGSKLVRDAGSTMTEIVESVARVAAIINEITTAAAEQSRGISKVNGDVSQLDEMTQRNAALAEEASAAAASMERQSEGLESAVATFKLEGDQQFARGLATSTTNGPAGPFFHGLRRRRNPGATRPQSSEAAIRLCTAAWFRRVS